MTTIILPLANKYISNQQIMDVAKLENVQVVLIAEKNQNVKDFVGSGIVLDVYPVGTTVDEMLAQTIKTLPTQNIVVVQKNCNFFSVQSTKLLLESQGADIAMLKNKKRTKIFGKLGDFAKNLCKKLFGFAFFEGNASMVYFSSAAHAVLKETNPTAMTKTNRWHCMNIQTITAVLPKQEYHKPPKIMLAKLAIYVVLLPILIYLSIFLLNLVTLSIVFGMMAMLLVLVDFLMIAFSALKLFCFVQVGHLYTKKVEFLERREL